MTRALRLPPSAAVVISGALHALLFLALVRVPLPRPGETVSVEIIETSRPAPPPPPAPLASPAPPPLAKLVPSPRRVPQPPPVAADAPPAAAAPELPPPPNEPPPAGAPPPERVPVRIGMSMSSTTTSGPFAAPVGNSLYGKVPRQGADPNDARPYQAERYAAPTAVTVLPRIDCDIPKSEYPEEAKSLKVEARVVLRVFVDADGHVADAKIVEDPGHGLGPAAVRSVLRHCTARAARVGDEAVAGWIPYKVRFELD